MDSYPYMNTKRWEPKIGWVDAKLPYIVGPQASTQLNYDMRGPVSFYLDSYLGMQHSLLQLDYATGKINEETYSSEFKKLKELERRLQIAGLPHAAITDFHGLEVALKAIELEKRQEAA